MRENCARTCTAISVCELCKILHQLVWEQNEISGTWQRRSSLQLQAKDRRTVSFNSATFKCPKTICMQYEEFRQAGHRLIDYIADYLGGVGSKPLFPDVDPRFLYDLFDEAIPRQGKPLAALQAALEEKLMPYLTHVNHPGYMGLITPSPNPAGILGDLLASAINQNVGAYTIGPAAVAMERRVIRWLNDLIGYGEMAGGNLTSGGMMANFIGLKLARDWTTGNRAQHEGLSGRWAVYVSEERHVSVDKSVDAVGAGRNALRTIPTNKRFEVDIEALEETLAKDKADGVKALCIVGLAGTTNLGAVDNLKTLSEIAKREGCWFHVDAAYGGGLLLSQTHSSVLKDLLLADSVTIDPHKWFYAPLDAGAVLVKDHLQLTASFGIQHAYLTDQTDKKSERYQFYVHGFEQSKRFRSLKVWMSFQHYGSGQLGHWVDNNVAQAKHLHLLAEEEGVFESATEPVMSAVCLRYKGMGLSDEQTGNLHFEVAARIEKSGAFWFATTIMKGKIWFRINPVNLHTSISHMEQLYALLRKACQETEAEIAKAGVTA
jgi:aromatic-L-amino-acid/L-tryptophan decarboxylase